MLRMSEDAYHTLDLFVQTVLDRVSRAACSVEDGHLDLMQALTALDGGKVREAEPWMTLQMDKWRTQPSSAGAFDEPVADGRQRT